MSRTFADQLRAAAMPAWSAAVNHRFVDELFAGTIADEQLARYLVQDYQFCDAFTALLGQAVASAPNLPSRLGHAGQLGFFAADENDYFVASFDALGVSEEDRLQPILSGPTSEFIALMMATRDTRDYAKIVIVLLVAEWLYREWAARDLVWPEENLYRGWIEAHNDPRFNSWVDWLADELEAVQPRDPSARAELESLFLETVRLELAFFDDVYA